MKSSRDIDKRQRIKVTMPGFPPFASIVVDVLRRYIAIGYPKGPELPPGFSWKNQQIGINFFREGDAGYFFQSKVLEDYATGKKYPILHITHNDNVVRTQKRNSVRVKTSIPAKLYPLKSVDEANEEYEVDRGLKALISDISEDGAAVLIGGRAKVGMPLKYQFRIGEKEIVVCGVVRGVNFDSKRNRSLLHIQALPISPRVKNAIRSYVYDLFGERQPLKTKKPRASR
jgi:c-di-GMP-binding flagellar brake protein YcgR